MLRRGNVIGSRASLLITVGMTTILLAPWGWANDCGAPIACVAPAPGFPPSSGNTPSIDMGSGWATFSFSGCPGGAPICSTMENLHHLDDPCAPLPPRCWCPAPVDYGHAWISHDCLLGAGGAGFCSTTIAAGGPFNAYSGGGPGSVVCNMPLTAPAGAVPPQIGLNPAVNSCDINSDPPFGVDEPPVLPTSTITCSDPLPVPVGSALLSRLQHGGGRSRLYRALRCGLPGAASSHPEHRRARAVRVLPLRW